MRQLGSQMAVFLINSCKFSGCGLIFSTLAELIQHIEDTHIDSDPRIIAKQEIQQPECLALSHILRFSDGARKEKRPRPSSVSPVSVTSACSLTPTGSEFDEESIHSEDENSDNSWTTQEEFTSDIILSMMSSQNREGEGDKPFSCPVPGCKKRYKNINGIKYHAKHGHKNEVRVKKPFKCKCGKSYRTASGLRNHSFTHHSTAEMLDLNLAQNGRLPIKMLTQAITSLSQNGIATAIPQAMIARTGQTLHAVPVSVASLPPNTVGISPNSRLAAAIPISQLAPLLDPTSTCINKQQILTNGNICFDASKIQNPLESSLCLAKSPCLEEMSCLVDSMPDANSLQTPVNDL